MTQYHLGLLQFTSPSEKSAIEAELEENFDFLDESFDELKSSINILKEDLHEVLYGKETDEHLKKWPNGK